jgi:hypothetical protein
VPETVKVAAEVIDNIARLEISEIRLKGPLGIKLVNI